MTIQKIGIIAQDGTDPAYVQGAYHVVNNLLRSCGATGKYQVFNAQNAGAFVNPLIHDGIFQAVLEDRYYNPNGYYQICAEPIMDGMLKYTAAHPDTEFLMITDNSIYANKLRFFLGVNRKAVSRSGRLLNTTIISTGRNSPYALDGITFQSVLMHELGHRFGTTDQRNRREGELREYREMGTHCTTPGCIMNVMNSLHEGRIAAHRRATYCPGCVAAMKREFSR